MADTPQNALAPRATETQTRSLLDQIADEQAHVAARYMPILSPKQFTEREKLVAELKDMLVEGVDYGVIPGTEKPTLLLPGAQKVCAYFGYVPRYVADAAIEDWDGQQFEEPLFYYRFTCELEKDGKAVGRGLGSCNSWESKYRYRWVRQDEAKRHAGWADFPTRGGAISEFTFAVDKAETAGKYGKPAAYWQNFRDEITAGTARQIRRKDSKGTERDAWEIDSTLYRISNENFPDSINTVLKIAKKRSYIDATLSATGLSQYFTQDVEDMAQEPPVPRETQTQTQERVKEERIENAAGDVLDAEIRPYIEGLANGTNAKVDSCFDFIQNQAIIAAGQDGEKMFLVRMKAFGERIAKDKRNPTVAELKGAALIEWGEVLRLRKAKAQREKDAGDAAFAVTR